MPAAPLCLVRIRGGVLEVDEAAASWLASLRTPEVSVVCSTGTSRIGRSYLLNQLIGRSDGFPTSAGVRPCTRGLWLWSELLGRGSGSGSASKGSVLLLDCQGVRGAGDAWEDASLFCLAAALSSVVLHHTVGAIDEAAIRQLCTLLAGSADSGGGGAAGRGAAAAARSGAGGEVGGGAAEHGTPSLLWVVRDFSLALRDASGALSAA